MPTTTNYGFYSPPLTGVTPNVPRDVKTLADAVDVALKAEETARIAGDAAGGALQVVVPDSDAGFPAAATAQTTATVVIDRYTVASAAYARRAVLNISAYVVATVDATEMNLVLFAGATTIGSSRITVGTSKPAQIVGVAKYTIPASTAVVFEARLSRNAGTGTFSSSISGSLTTSTLTLVKA